MNNISYKSERIKSDRVFMLIVLFGLILRLHNLGKYSLWFDEAINLLLGPKYLWAGLMDKAFKTPELSLVSLFPVLVHFWKFLGKSEFILRLLPLAFGVFSIIGIYMIAKLLFDKKIAELSAFILSVSPLHVYYSQELKYNTLIVFLSIFSVYFYIKSLRESKLIFWLAFTAFTILDIYVFFMTVFLLVSLNAHYLLYFNKYKKLAHKWAASQAVIVFFLIPWAIRIFQQILNPDPFSLFGWIQRPNLLTLTDTFRIFNTGYGASFFIGYSAVFLCLFLFLAGVINIAADRKQELSLLLSWFLVPVILIYIVSLTEKPVFLHRSLIYVTPAYYIILACGLAGIRNKLIWIPFILLTIFFFIPLRNQFDNILPLASVSPANNNLPMPLISIYHPGVFLKVENKPAAEYIERNLREGDVIGHVTFNSLLPFIYYHSGKFDEKCIGEVNHLSNKFYHFHSDPIFQKRFSFVDVKEFTKGKGRIWVIISFYGLLDRKSPVRYRERAARLRTWLDKNCGLIDSKDFLGLKVNLYQIKPR